MVYNELEQGDILSEVRVGLATIAYTDILLRSIWAIFKIRQTPVHILPTGFVRIRHYGLLANRCKASALRQCRQLLGQLVDLPVAPPKTVAQWVQQWTGLDITRCPQCGYQPLMRTPVPRSGDASKSLSQ